MIVDDEPIAHQVILNMCGDLAFMELKGQCFNALEAIDFLGKEAVDLIFLDIQLPKLGGFDFLRTLKKPPMVIVISAHGEYALEGYDLNVVDYLLKPFDFERFLRAVNKARNLLAGKASEGDPERHETLFLKDGKKHHQVRLDDICYIEACGNYSLVHLTEGRVLTQEKISDLENKLPEAFIRVHKSYVVASDKIAVIEGQDLCLGDKRIPIGRVYKANVARLLERGGSKWVGGGVWGLNRASKKARKTSIFGERARFW